MIEKSEFIDWKNNVVTQEFLKAVAARSEQAIQILALSAGVDPLSDRFTCGMIHAMREVLDVQFDDIEETKDA